MKRIFTGSICFAILTGMCHAQDSLQFALPNASYETNHPDRAQWSTREYYLKKRNNLNTTGWMLLGVGAVLSIGGSRQYENAIHSPDRNLNDEIGGAVCAVVGTAMVVASVPVLVSSGYYNKKVVKMTADFKIEPCQSGVAVKQYPAVGLRISL